MKMHKFGLFAALFFLVLAPFSAQAQACAQFVNQALQLMGDNCTGIDNNNACYGYYGVSATFSEPVDPSIFSQPADITLVEILDRLQTAPYNPDANVWGVAVMRLQANIPGTLPGQSVSVLLLGDVQMEADPNAAAPMQAFTLRTGLGQAACEALPPSSLTVQSPRGLRVDLTMNGANIELGSTATFTAQDGRFTVRMSDGRAVINDDIIVPVGFSLSATLDENDQIVPESWESLEPLSEEELDALNLLGELPEDILDYEIEPPTLEEVELLNAFSEEALLTVDPYLLNLLAEDFVAQGFSPIDIIGITPTELRDYVLDYLPDFVVDDALYDALLNSFDLDADMLASIESLYIPGSDDDYLSQAELAAAGIEDIAGIESEAVESAVEGVDDTVEDAGEVVEEAVDGLGELVPTDVGEAVEGALEGALDGAVIPTQAAVVHAEGGVVPTALPPLIPTAIAPLSTIVPVIPTLPPILPFGKAASIYMRERI